MNKVKKTTDYIYNEYVKRDIIIIHLADIHFNKHTKIIKLNKIKEEIIKNNPDYIMITGDLLDNPVVTKDKNKTKELLIFLTDLASFAKVIISLGNHDIFCHNDLRFFIKLNDIKNIFILNNDSYQDELIYVAGITLSTSYYYNITNDESSTILEEIINTNKKITMNLSKTIPKILLIHSPIKILDVIDNLKEFDLILSGHTHGGMIPDFLDKLFKKNIGIIAPNKKLFPSIARGKVERYINSKNITLIITGGITKLSERSAKLLSKINWIYKIDLNKIIITKKRGKY